MKHLAAIIVTLVAIALLSVQTLAQAPSAPPRQSEQPAAARGAPPTRAPQTSRSLDAADLESWLDGFVPASIEQGAVAGAVVSVVKDGRVLLSKGYGLADIATKRPMTGDGTLVRAGSTSKLFTWTSVMQLVEQGKLELHVNINRYLDFKVPAMNGRAVTLTDLMTHRAGFEEGLKDAVVNDPAQFQQLDVFLKRHQRPILFEPGKVPAYSNYGTALAGYIVQRVSGERFEDYVERHIFVPLRMAHSTFRQPLSPTLAAGMSRGYMSGADAPHPYELITFAPAGSLSTTATDMANFMIAHLQNGRFENGEILDPATARLMHSPSVAAEPGFDVMAHGFFSEIRNGHALLGHGGDTILFHSDMELLPQDGVGIFVSFNSRGASDSVYGIRERLLKGFLDRYFPGPPPANPPALTTARSDSSRIVGRYETSRRVETGFISLFYVLQGQETVTVRPDGTIVLSSSPDRSFREVAHDVWREVDGTRILKLTNANGLKTILDSHNPTGVLQAVPISRNASVNLYVFLGALLVLLGGAIAWLTSEVSRRVYRQPPPLAGRPLVVRRLVRIAVLADLAYLLAWFFVLKPILGSQVSFYTTALDPVIRTLQIACLVPILGAVAGLWNAGTSLKSGRSWIIKAGSVLIAAGLVGVVWIAFIGGLMTFTLNY